MSLACRAAHPRAVGYCAPGGVEEAVGRRYENPRRERRRRPGSGSLGAGGGPGASGRCPRVFAGSQLQPAPACPPLSRRSFICSAPGRRTESTREFRDSRWTPRPATLAALGCAIGFDREPDVIVSGINPGWNTGVQGYVSSGTMGAARVALDRGFTGIAVSHAPGLPEDKRAIAAATARFVVAAREQGVSGAAAAGQHQRTCGIRGQRAGATHAAGAVHAVRRRAL